MNPKKKCKKKCLRGNEDLGQPKKKTPLELLADELKVSDGCNSEFGDVILPTPPECHDEDQAATSETQEDQIDDNYRDDEDEEEDETEGSDEEREYTTLKDYYKKGKASSTHEKFLIMFCEHMKNCIGGCKKERQSSGSLSKSGPPHFWLEKSLPSNFSQ